MEKPGKPIVVIEREETIEDDYKYYIFKPQHNITAKELADIIATLGINVNEDTYNLFDERIKSNFVKK